MTPFRWSDPIDRRFVKDVAIVALLAGLPAAVYVVTLIAWLRR